ncbi:MAG: N-acetylmuramoyl-L-alanine amidase [Steroidobacterales bacterium]|jgi:N-acetylmuramoyl-L-alanine amidase
MIRQIFRERILLGLTVLVPLGLAQGANAAQLRAMTLAAAGSDAAQVSLDVKGSTAQKLFTLENPARVVIDLPNTHLAADFQTPAALGVVAAVRVGAQPHGTLRVVLQLRSALSAKSAWGTGEGARHLLVTLGEPVAAVADAPPKAVSAAHAPADGDRDVIIAVDAGHGGVDPGAIGHGGTREKDVTLAIARELARAINARPGMHAVLTRDRDEFLELRDRIGRAHRAHADMFISVHADSIRDRSVSGASVYVLSVHGASSEAARWLAEHENAADLVGGVRPEDKGALEPVLIDATQSEIIGVSATAAERVVAALEGVGEVRKAQVQHAGFVVLKSRDIPSMLVETAYISNPEEERRLRTSVHQAQLADAIAGGLRSYFMHNPPDGTRFKQERRLASAADTQAAVTP